MNTIKRISVAAGRSISTFVKDFIKNIKGMFLMTSATAGISSFLVYIGCSTVSAVIIAAISVYISSH